MSELRQQVLEKFERIEQSSDKKAYDLSQIYSVLGIEPEYFRSEFYSGLSNKKLGNISRLEKEILNMERREEFRKSPSMGNLQLNILQDLLSVRRISEAVGKSALELPEIDLEHELVRYITKDEETNKTYDRLGIRPNDIDGFQKLRWDDTLTILGILQEKGKKISLEYVRSLIENNLPDSLAPLSDIVKGRLELECEFAQTGKETLLESIDRINKIDLHDLTLKAGKYQEGIEILMGSIKRPQPDYLRSIECASDPLAIRFSPRGDLIVFDTDKMVRRYSIENGKVLEEIHTSLRSGVRGNVLGATSFFGGLYVDEDETTYAYAFGKMQKISQNQTGDNSILPIYFSKDSVSIPGSEDGGMFVVGMAKTLTGYCVSLFDRSKLQLFMYDKNGHKTDKTFQQEVWDGNSSPRIQSYNEDIFLATENRLYRINPESGLAHEVLIEGLNQNMPFSLTNFDFDAKGTLWTLNKLQFENFPSVKAYSLACTGKGLATRLETFFPLRSLDYQIGFRDITIHRGQNMLAISDPLSKKVDLYSINPLLKG
jgi:hypothetical protein